MNKYLRIALVLAVLVGVVVVAGNQSAWAGKFGPPNASASDVSAQFISSLPTTVDPGGCSTEVPVDETATTLCGIATISSNNGEIIGLSYLGNRPEGFKNKMVTVYLSEPGDATLCFAAKYGGTIYFYNIAGETWLPIFTTVDNGVACATISQSGDYVLGK